jgi:hypothetical protein
MAVRPALEQTQRAFDRLAAGDRAWLKRAMRQDRRDFSRFGAAASAHAPKIEQVLA